MDKTIIYLALLTTFFFIASLSLDYYLAHADYLAYRYNQWDHTPTVCIKNYIGVGDAKIYSAVKSWSIALNDKTHSHSWSYIIRYDRLGCDIDVKVLNMGNQAYGMSSCGENHCDISVYGYTIPSDYLFTTVQHEMGHALGLGHRLPYTKCDFTAVVLSNDIMMAQAGKFQKITGDDLDALIYMYEEKGFEKPNKEGLSYFPLSDRPLNCV